MSTAPNPIAGTGSSAEPIIPDAGLEPVDTPTTGVQDDGGTPAEPQTTEGQEPEAGKGGEEQVREDGRLIPKWMKELQAANPEAYKKAKGDLFELRDRRSVHPTAQAARQEHDLVQSLGGPEGVATLREDAGVFKTAAQQFMKGDPAFVKDLFDEDPIAAALHVAPMLELYKQHDLAGFQSTLAREWDKEFQAVGFGSALGQLRDAVNAGKKEDAASILDGFIKWYNSIGEVARKAEDPRVKSLLAERAKQHDTRQQTEQQEFLKGYKTEAINTVLDEASRVFDSFFKGRKLDAEDRTDLLRDAVTLANRTVEADKTFMEQRQGHLDRNDKHSAVQLTKARFAQALPDAVKKIARRYGMTSGTAAPAAQRTQQQTTGKPVEQGWTAVTARPSPEEIDRSRTSNEMILSGKAILKDGKKVDWSKLKQQ